jgi:methylase of polypeptide subunit release factors
MDAMPITDVRPAPARPPQAGAKPAVRNRTSKMPLADRALLEIGEALRDCGYRFTTITPATHRRVVARGQSGPASLEDIFGWSRPFGRSDLSPELLRLLAEANALEPSGTVLRSAVRFSTLDSQIFVHSAFPTEEADAVFFGPDTYRFARWIAQSLRRMERRAFLDIVDIGAGSGAGGLHAGVLLHDAAPRIVLTDINRRALRFCRINAALNGQSTVEIVDSDLFASLDEKFDLMVANPPYLVDPLARLYRHGGGAFGADLSLRIVEQGIQHLAPGGRLLLYTGSAIVGGADQLHDALQTRLAGQPVRFTYEELDPDVFGEELESAPYDQVDRIAVVGVTIEAVAGGSR